MASLGTTTADYPTQVMAVGLVGSLPCMYKVKMAIHIFLLLVIILATCWMKALPLSKKAIASAIAGKLFDKVFLW